MNTKKLLAILLAIVMLIGMMPVTALAADKTSGKCGDNATWSYDTASGTLTISGTGPMNDINVFYMPWGDYCEDMKTLVIENGITRIGAKSFTGCSFTEVSIPDSVTEIGANAFADCVNLKTIDLPDITVIEPYTFLNCAALQSITIPDSVTTIGQGSFAQCKAMTEMNIPASVETIETYQTLWDQLNMTAYNVDPDNENYSSDENGILYNKAQTSLIKIPAMYAGEYVMPDTVNSLVANAFLNCSKLTSVTINANITYNLSFTDCLSLESIWIDEANPIYSGDSKGAMFNKDYTKLMAVPVMLAADYEIPDSVTIIGNRAFVGSTITELVIPEGVTELEIGAFSNCPNLKQVTLPESLEKIGQTVFNNCLGVTDIYYNGTEAQWAAITIGNYNGTLSDATIHFKGETEPTPEPTPEVKPGINGTIGTNCTWNFNEGVLTISGEGKMGGYMLNQKKEKTDAPWFGGGNGVNAGYGDFSSDIHEIVVEEGITGIGPAAFAGLNYVHTVSLPSTLTAIDDNVFAYCNRLMNITLPDGLTKLGTSAFESCGLKEIVIPGGVGEIPFAAFFDCSGLQFVTIEEGVTSIGGNAFAKNNVLTKLNLPATLTEISGSQAFWGANNLLEVNFAGTREVWKAVEMTDSVRTQLEAVIHYGDIVPEVKPTPTPAVNPFEDVSESDWFCAPVMWAVENGITSGLTPTSFGHDASCTRAQVVTFLYAAAGKPEINPEYNPFTDVSESDWFYAPVMWAVENNITGGLTPDSFGPNATCTRAQVVTFLYAAAGKPQMDAAESPFTDVMSGDWYLNPVLWAVEKGVTSGLTPDTFGPNNTCTRAQVVTFLYANETK